ncbi:cation:proton antiporter [Sulfurimonas marina]|uniref:Cation:proton antiporter n=1 Tax=Sulfurimonas marina TaxID=2590551 RepID=A0A7M1AYS6_9BACT|nr:cation:proton antiporter [Sulfurimonas marina]QOP41532.1 cation:proton antiporter [Sulfurimonas marina]
MGHELWSYSAIILFFVVIAKIVSQKTSTIDVIWLIIFGSLGVNLGILPTHNEILEAIGDWGIIFIMFALGFDEDLNHFIEGLKRSFGIAVIGAIFPFLAGYYTAGLFGYGFNTQMIWGLTMTATAVSLTMVSLREQGLHKTTASTAIMSAAVVDDILSLIGLSIMIPIAVSTTGENGSMIEFNELSIIIAKVLAFFAIISFIGLVLFPDSITKERDKKYSALFHVIVKVRQYLGIRKLLMAYSGKFTPLVMIFTAFVFGALADRFGFHPAIGAYFAGLFLREEYFMIKVDNQLRSHRKDSEFVINHLAYTIFGPIFFVELGSKLILDMELLTEVFPIVFVLFFAVFILQVLSAALAARFTGKYEWYQSVMIGLGMLGRAELAFIVIDIAYVDEKIIDIEQFDILIFTIFLLNIAVPLAIKRWEPYYMGTKRLELFGIKLSK